MLKDFKQFILRGNVVELAIAVVMGVAFTAVVTATVADLLTPLIAAVFGKTDFSSLQFTINGSTFHYGSWLNALFAFVSLAVVVFFFVMRPMTALQHRLGLAPPEEPTRRPCPECTTEIPDAARRCPQCTAVLSPAAGSAVATP
jgi:large conductance mechanosensitive channel